MIPPDTLVSTLDAAVAAGSLEISSRDNVLELTAGSADPVVDSTWIVVRRGDAGVATQVRQALGIGRVGSKRDSLRRVDVSVILGPDYRPDEDGRP